MTRFLLTTATVLLFAGSAAACPWSKTDTTASADMSKPAQSAMTPKQDTKSPGNAAEAESNIDQIIQEAVRPAPKKPDSWN